MLKLKDIKDQDQVIKHLEKALLKGYFSHAYMFIGPKGVGKKTTAEAFIKSILCSNEIGFCDNCSNCLKFDDGNYTELMNFFDDGGKIKIEDVRRIKEAVSYKQIEGKYRIIFIENGERLTPESSNALLKTLEEPNPNTIFVITISEVDKVLATMLSRVEKYYFNKLSEGNINEILSKKGYNDVKRFSKLGSIDEALNILENSDGEVISFPELVELFNERSLDKLFKIAKEYEKKKYLESFLSYLLKESYIEYKFFINKNFDKMKYYEKMIFEIERAKTKISLNINRRHILEKMFLRCLEYTRRNNG